MKKLVLSVIATATMGLVGCGNSTNLVQPIPPTQAQNNNPVAQVEFLARPGIGEALLFTNNLLNTYNAVTPRFVAAALATPTGPEGLAAKPVLDEAVSVLTLLENADGNANNGLTVTQIVGAFLPDVMRIDTSLNFTADATPAYPTFNGTGTTLVGGRKLTDDVIDITLTVLTDGAVTSDGVNYYRSGGVTNTAVGHSNLNGQGAQFGPATFPFLAPPQ